MKTFQKRFSIFVFLFAFQLGFIPVTQAAKAAKPAEVQTQNPTLSAVPSEKSDLKKESKDDITGGFSSVGRGIKNGGVVVGRTFKTVGVKVASGFKKAGSAIKNFFGGKKGSSVEERDLKAEGSNTRSEESAFRYVPQEAVETHENGTEASKAGKELVKEEVKSGSVVN